MKETVTDPLLFFLRQFYLVYVCRQYMILFVEFEEYSIIKACFVIEDIGFGIFTAVMAFIFLCTYNDGELRGFFSSEL